MNFENETIVALATPPGRGGVAVIRLSGSNSKTIALNLIDTLPSPRHAFLCEFFDRDKIAIDKGLALFFPNPHSFTGEDVLELHCHGGPVVVDLLIERILELGARLARPGEFSERAFLNGKIDLIQAEAIADLIDSGSKEAARGAVRSLQGEFSKQINILLVEIIELRKYIEAAIDFSDEEIDFLAQGQVEEKLKAILQQLEKIKNSADQGVLLKEGLRIVILGRPNAGKSSLLNALVGEETAIVTSQAGTTRDVLKESICLDGIPLHLVDTAGLRETTDEIEKEGIRRAWKEVDKADHILLMLDVSDSDLLNDEGNLIERWSLPSNIPITLVRNKIDLIQEKPSITKRGKMHCVDISAKTHEGLNLLKDHLKACSGATQGEHGIFTARRRHLLGLKKTQEAVEMALFQLRAGSPTELVAEDLRYAQQHLSEITGKFTVDDLLGEIFSSFCVGK